MAVTPSPPGEESSYTKRDTLGNVQGENIIVLFSRCLKARRYRLYLTYSTLFLFFLVLPSQCWQSKERRT